MKWLKESAQKKDDDIRIYDSLAREIIDTYNNRVRTRTVLYEPFLCVCVWRGGDC